MSELFGRLPPLATLVSFEAAYRLGNFTRAAEELYMSQASVSRRIRELETDLGVSLFDRHRHDVTPTPEAEVFATSVRLSLSELSSTANVIRETSLGTKSLRVFSDPSLASLWVAPMLGEYQRKNPEVQIRVVSSCESAETTNEPFDIALQYGRAEESALTVDFMADEAVFPVCSPTFAARQPTPITRADLARLPLLHVEYEDPSWARWHDLVPDADHGRVAKDQVAKDQVAKDTAAKDAAPSEQAMIFSSYHVCLDVAEQGEGIALGWERSVKPRLDAGTLVRIPGITLEKAGVINAYLPNKTVANVHAPEFLALLKSTHGLGNLHRGHCGGL